MTKEEQYNNKHSFESDRQAKDKLIQYYKKLGEKYGFEFVLDDKNNKDKFARTDIKFKYVKNNKQYDYSVELKYRRDYTYEQFIEKYPDVMYEEDKIDFQIEESKKGIRTYFVNLFKNDKALVFPINENTKYQIGISIQNKYTEKYCDKKQPIVKAYLKYDKGKLIDINE